MSQNQQNLTSPALIDENEKKLDQSLRPRTLKEYRGQPSIKKNLKIFLEAAKIRQEPLDHILLYGPPGLGKTTLAYILAGETGVNLRVTSGPAIERAGDLASILTSLSPGDILFIDEIHRLRKVVEETMYPAMEDFSLDLVVGRGPAARTLRLDLPRFSLIGATTRVGLMSAPLRDRFGVTFRLDFYEIPTLAKIIQRSALVLGVKMTKEACFEVAKRSRGTPRIANRLLKRVRDYVQVKKVEPATPALIKECLELLQVDLRGLDRVDRQLLEAIISKFKGGPVGIETLAAAISEDVGTIEEVIEPYLLQQGFIKRTARGRMATQLAYKHLDLETQEELL